MGTWGPGLYSDDFALDLRSSIAQVARLPVTIAEMVKLLRERTDEDDEPRFWLVLADRFHALGIDAEDVRERALAILEAAPDQVADAESGMSRADLRKREALRAALVEKLRAPVPTKARRVMKAPQPFVMDVGDVCVFPTSGGAPVNPYVSASAKWKPEWAHDGWGAVVVLERGLAFGYLAWLRVAAPVWCSPERPTLESLASTEEWTVRTPGTCPPLHFDRMRFERLGNVGAVAAIAPLCKGTPDPGDAYAVADIGLVNQIGSFDREMNNALLLPPHLASHVVVPFARLLAARAR